MLFEVIAEKWDYRPRRCTMICYLKGHRGFLPEDVVLQGVASGHLVIVEEHRDVGPEPTDQDEDFGTAGRVFIRDESGAADQHLPDEGLS